MANKIKCIKNVSDIEEGESYLPTENPSDYLDDKLLEQVCELVQEKYSNSFEIISFINKIEKIHAESVLGSISSDYEDELISKLANDYRNKHKKWIHHEKAYKEFYKLINREDVF